MSGAKDILDAFRYARPAWKSEFSQLRHRSRALDDLALTYAVALYARARIT